MAAVVLATLVNGVINRIQTVTIPAVLPVPDLLQASQLTMSHPHTSTWTAGRRELQTTWNRHTWEFVQQTHHEGFQEGLRSALGAEQPHSPGQVAPWATEQLPREPWNLLVLEKGQNL